MREDFTCEICGEPTSRKIMRLVEGVKMIVCPQCQDMGEEIPTRSSYRGSSGVYNSRESYSHKEPPATYSRYNQPKKKKFVNTIGSNQSSYVKRKPRLEELELVEDYRNIMKNTRQKNSLTQSEFANKAKISESVYKSVENGRTDLLIKDAMKIEEVFKIKITKFISDEEEEEEINYKSETFKKNNTEYTLGDVFVKRKKGRPSSDD